MVKQKAKASAKRIKDKADIYRVAPLENSEIKIPPKIRSSMRARRKASVLRCEAEAALAQANCETPEELSRREQAAIRIVQKLGIYEELNELREIALAREKRCRNARTKAGSRAFD